MKVRILSIEENKALVSVMEDGCSSVGCEGCSCSKKLKTMKIELPEEEEWNTGEIISLSATGAIFDAILLLVLPVAASAGLSLSGISPILSLCGGVAVFAALAFLLRFGRVRKHLSVTRLS